MSGSTMLNLSLLTSDMWSVLIRIFAYHEKVDWMYFVAFVAVAIGLVVYSGFDKEKHVEVADEAEQSQCLDEEAGVACSNKSYLTASSSTNHGKQ
nr:solute carrier family 35 member F1-like [Tanacetum cinerariifolium]